MPIQLWITLSIASISLVACAGDKDKVLPADGPDMKAIYQHHMSDVGLNDRDVARDALKRRALQSNASDLGGYTRDVFNELDAHFPRLPNPTLVLYVFPHLSGEERVPVPGYATTFSLYTQVEYALPGELNEPHLRQPERD